MNDGLARPRESTDGQFSFATAMILGSCGTLALKVEVDDDELRELVCAGLPKEVPGRRPCDLPVCIYLDLGRDPAAQITRPEDGKWDVWGPTPAWDATVVHDEGGLACRFSFDPGFVSRLSRSRTASLDALWRAALRMTLAVAAPLAGGLLVHGAALVPGEGQGALAFVGPSGSGKTTMASRLPDWTRVSDDTLLIWRHGDGWYVTGTPLLGREKNPVLFGAFPLRALISLAPDANDLSLSPLGQSEAFQVLIARTFFYPSAAMPENTQSRLIEMIGALSHAVPMFELQSNLTHLIEGPILSAGGFDV